MVLAYELNSDALPVEGKGQTLMAREVVRDSPVDVKVGDRIELRDTSGKAFQTTVNGISPFYVDPFPEHGCFQFGILVAADVPVSFCAKGVQVWKVEEG